MLHVRTGSLRIAKFHKSGRETAVTGTLKRNRISKGGGISGHSAWLGNVPTHKKDMDTADPKAPYYPIARQ